MLNRREALLATAAVSAAPLAGNAQTAKDARLNTLFDQFFQENLRFRPESATNLGLDKGANADLKSKLSDESSTGIAKAKAMTADQLARMARIDRAALSTDGKLSYDAVLYTRKSSASIQAFDYGGQSYGPSPYVVSQLTGAYQSVPDFLDTKHKIDTAADAEAYLARLDAFAGVLDANTDRMKHDEALGVIPPDFVVDLALAQMAVTRTSADQSLMVTSIAKRTAANGIAGDWAKRATAIYDGKVAPALDRQIAETRHLRAAATHDAGVWRLPQGAAFYAAALKATTTVSLSPDEVHKLGLDQSRDIGARLDAELKKQGMTLGTIGQRVAALFKDPRYLFPDTDAGKVAIIAYCNDRLNAIRPRLPTKFKPIPPNRFVVRRVPPATEAGAAMAFSQGPALDGSRPGLVYFNLHDTGDWPKWDLDTTVFHEGLPGHQLEGGLALSNTRLPLIRKSLGFSGYAEGWALYAEQLADEMGLYDDEPLGRIGYLRAQLFRASRCVVDTGIHHLRWSREKAINYFMTAEGDAPGSTAKEVERYCTNPGQACSYKIGHTVFVKGRARAMAALGDRFDIKDYHEAVLNCGRVPLEVLDGVIDGWVAGKRV